MNRFTLRSLAILSLVAIAAAAAPTHAQSGAPNFFQPSATRVAIPFAFTAGEATLPAGTYTIKRVSQTGGAYLIQSADGKASAAVLTAGTLTRGRTSLPAKLVFHRYEGACYLSEVWTASSTVGRAVSTSKAERALAKQDATPDVVAVLVRP